ncbi:MAG: maleylpyruvate isomerase N-terminal domain-containing protein [Chloroflexota bacterium]
MAPRTVRHTRADVLARAEAEYRALDRIVSRLRPDDFDRPVFGDWTVKDALAHIVAWKAETLRQLRGQRRKPGEALPVNERNQLIFDAWHGRPAVTLVAEHRRVQRELRAQVRALPDEYFTGRERSPLWPDNLLGHSAAHRRRHLEEVFER